MMAEECDFKQSFILVSDVLPGWNELVPIWHGEFMFSFQCLGR